MSRSKSSENIIEEHLIIKKKKKLGSDNKKSFRMHGFRAVIFIVNEKFWAELKQKEFQLYNWRKHKKINIKIKRIKLITPMNNLKKRKTIHLVN